MTASAEVARVVTGAPPPLVLVPGSWQYRLVKKAEALHAIGKSSTLLLRLGNGPVTFWKVVPDGQCNE